MLFTSLAYTTAFADNSIASTEIADESTEDTALRYVPCPVGSGKHQMLSRGFGTLYQGPPNNCTLVFRLGQATQCMYCKLVLVSEYDHRGGKLGRYAFDSPGYDINLNGCVMYKNASDIKYNSNVWTDPVFAGFEWGALGRTADN